MNGIPKTFLYGFKRGGYEVHKHLLITRGRSEWYALGRTQRKINPENGAMEVRNFQRLHLLSTQLVLQRNVNRHEISAKTFLSGEKITLKYQEVNNDTHPSISGQKIKKKWFNCGTVRDMPYWYSHHVMT